MGKNSTATVVIVIALAIGLFLLATGKLSLFSLLNPTIVFAGTTWSGDEVVSADNPAQLTFSSWINQNGFWETTYGSTCTWDYPNNAATQTYTSAKSYENADDILIIYSYVLENPSNTHDKYCEGGFSISLSNSAFISDRCVQGSGNNQGDVNRCYSEKEISMVKLKNNFDGTWDVMQYAGIGDIFVKQSTITADANPHLKVQTYQTTNSIGGSWNACQSNGRVIIYNIVEKTNEVVNCNAGETLLENGSCVALEGLLLENERAVKEELLAELARIEARLLEKEALLQGQIDALNQLLRDQLDNDALIAQLDSLTEELNRLKDSGASEAAVQAVRDDIARLRNDASGGNAQLGNIIDQYVSLNERLGDVENGIVLIQERNEDVVSSDNPYGQNPIYRGEVQEAVGNSNGGGIGVNTILLVALGLVGIVALVLVNRKK